MGGSWDRDGDDQRAQSLGAGEVTVGLALCTQIGHYAAQRTLVKN
ncbi:MAG: hypothetical protein R2710_07610 [Acidimicrobiales bacterium]